MKNKNRILPGVLLAWVLSCLITVTVYAVSYNLTVIPTQVETGNTFNGETVNICLVARIENGKYQMEPAFAAKGLTVETIFAYDHTKVASELADYVVEASVSHRRKTTTDGKADFGSVAAGLYLVFPAENQLKKDNPFFIPFLVTVIQEDVVCYPKVPDEPDPPPPTPPRPTDPTSPTSPTSPQPPKTSDDAQIELAILAMVLSGLGGIVLTVHYHHKRRVKEPD